MKMANNDGAPEIFYSIQGEGRNMGRPSVFARSSLCNLHCIWCDTDYTWNWKGTRFEHVRDSEADYKKFDMADEVLEVSPEKVAEMIHQYPCKHVILTGGEPMMHQDDWVKVMTYLRNQDADYFFEVETNATLLPTPEFDAFIAQYNLSPKLSNSNNKRSLREKPDVLHFFAKDSRSVFKFVIAEDQDLKEVQDLIAKYQIAPENVYLMPEGTSPEQLTRRRSWLTQACMEYGYWYTDRLHVQIWGDKRGV